ncbi:MAG: diadenylate cyclase, partial [bacterium]
NFLFVRFCTSNKIFLPIVFKILTLFIFLLSLKVLELGWIFASFLFLNLIVTLLVVFVYQPEYRFFFIKYKNLDFNDANLIKRLFGINENLYVSTRFLDELIEAVYNLADKKIGALIVIERKISLDYYINNGYSLSSDVSNVILESIFNKYSPLHDGAVIVRDGKIVAAKCFLPINTSEVLEVEGLGSYNFGARHRAAIGITQTTDAISIVVSETNYTVSFCYDGKLLYNLKSEELYELLKEKIMFNTVPFEKIERKS